ncbi:MAG TPA: hypothetical protein PLL66_02710 [Bacteroidales bacterium]|nr:hypothetical protein [Bacteroidales bacterium]
MKKRFLFIVVVISVFALNSCESSYIHFNDEGTFIKDTILNPIDTVYFGEEILPLLQNNCGSCHFAGTEPDLESPELYHNLINGNYLNLIDPERSTLFNLPDPGHADDYLTSEQHVLIVEWIEQGALDN